MREINYYCDVCHKKADNPKAELDSIQLNMAYTHNWESALPLAKNLHDIQLCKKCGETLNSIIVNAIAMKGFDKISYKGENYDN